jgi:acyl-CoA synthetase (NDP forming)
MGARGAPPELAPVPSYRFPESAVTALAHATAYAAWRRRPTGAIPVLARIDRDVMRHVVDHVLARGGGWLTPAEAQSLFEAAGIAVASATLATTEQEAIAAAREIGYPVALKAIGPEILHKTDVGGVMLDIGGDEALAAALRTLKTRVGDAMTAALVQEMVTDGVELIVGAVLDPTFGSLIACGSGGILVDLLHDTVFRLHPLTDRDAVEMVEEVRSAALLRGYRGHAPADERAVHDTLLRVSALVEICPEIQELDVNPLKVLAAGARAIDVRVRVNRREPAPPTRRISY